LLLAALLAGCGGPPPAVPPAAPPAVAPAAPPQQTAPASAPEDAGRPAEPVRVRLPGLEVDAVVAPVGVDESGAMAVPEDVDTVGWYRFGPGPGAAAGSAVLTGHVDDRIQGLGAFYRLGELAPGDPVEVTLADGSVLAYRVTTTDRIPKAELPTDELFARAGDPRLTLITCGGEFDRAARSYQENVVVTAERAG
jgi:LPXTG-site transpeptidase (sortase) family protein